MRVSLMTAAVMAGTCVATASGQSSFRSTTPGMPWTPTNAGTTGSYLAATYSFDDGSSENALGVSCGQPSCQGTSDMVWAQYFDTRDPAFANSPSDTITRVDVAIGSPSNAKGPPAGTSFNVYVFEDPTDSGNPSNIRGADLVTQGVGTNSMPNTDVFEQVGVPPGIVTGGFWVIATMSHELFSPGTGSGELPAAVDGSVMSLGRAWANCVSPGGTWNPTTPQATNCGGWGAVSSGVWMLRAEGLGFAAPTTFCTAKTMLTCGPAAISATGIPSGTATSGFVVTAAPTRGCRAGLLLYSNQPTGPGISFGGPGDGLLCLSPMGLRRAGPIDSGGTSPNVCDGVLAIDMNAFRANMWTATGCNPPPGQNSPAGLLNNPGSVVNGQMWYRDSVATGQGLSDGLSWTIGP